jgi:hypothetical protein
LTFLSKKDAPLAMAFEIFLQSFRSGAPGGGNAAGALALLLDFGAEQDEFGAWQVDLDDEGSAEVTGLAELKNARPGGRWKLACTVRLSELTPRGADLLFGLAQAGLMALIFPHDAAEGGAVVLLADGVSRDNLPGDRVYDAPEGISNPTELRDALLPWMPELWSDADDQRKAYLLGKNGITAQLWAWMRGRIQGS